MKTIPFPQGPKAKLFAERQEAVRKDVERAFGVLQAQFAKVRGPSHMMEEEDMSVIMKACVILHNIIVEDEHDNYELAFDYDVLDGSAPPSTVSHERYPCYETYFQRTAVIRDPQIHAHLQEDLKEKI